MGIERRGQELSKCPINDFSPRGLSQLIPIEMQGDPYLARLIEKLATTKFTKYILRDIRSRVMELGGRSSLPCKKIKQRASTARDRSGEASKPTEVVDFINKPDRHERQQKNKRIANRKLLLSQGYSLREVLRRENKTETTIDAVLRQWFSNGKITQEVYDRNMLREQKIVEDGVDLSTESGTYVNGKKISRRQQKHR
jgi:hypothetical protein